MRDRLSKERRSWNMSRIRGKDTTPEKVVRSLLHRLGYRFRLQVRIPVGPMRKAARGVRGGFKVQGSAGTASQRSTNNPQLSGRRFITPDIVLVKRRLAVFVHGCFWHRHRGCKNCTTPTNRREWWLAKLNGNAARDKLHLRALRKLGWRTLVVWECQTEKPAGLESLSERLKRLLT